MSASDYLISENLRSNLDYETFKNILGHSSEEIYITDPHKTIHYISQTCEQNYGIKPEELIGGNAANFPQFHQWAPSLYDFFANSNNRVSFKQKYAHGNKFVLSTATPILNENGLLDYIICNVQHLPNSGNSSEPTDGGKPILPPTSARSDLNLISQNKKIVEIMALLKKIAPLDIPVLLLGESGTGKSAFANYLHQHGGQENSPMITINCASIPENLFESELFGYSKGAFTGANSGGKMGLLEMAAEGTLFLDEIGDMPLSTQGKLLRVLQDKKYYSIGSAKEKSINCRIVAATNCDLPKLVSEKKFREDLYYRLCVIEVYIPPLRERVEEITPLLQLFLRKCELKYKTKAPVILPNCLTYLNNHPWCGNIRQLQNLVERLFLTFEGAEIDVECLPQAFLADTTSPKAPIRQGNQSLNEAIDQLQSQIITEYYQKLKSSVKVAQALNISQTTANRLIRKYVTQRH